LGHVINDQRPTTNDQRPTTNDVQSQSFVVRRSSFAQLLVVLLAFVVLATAYSVVTPLGEGPDELGHARYVFFLAREARLPVQRTESGESDVPGEGHQPPLAYVLMAPLAAWLPDEERQFDLPGNPRFTWAGGAELNAVAHGSREYPPWRGFVLAWRLARLLSVALGAATVIFTYLTAWALVDERPTTKDEGVPDSFVLRPSSFVPVAAAALVAFNPQFLFISALVTNDALLVTLSAALLWLVVRNAERRSSGAAESASSKIRQASISAAIMGLVLGLALITKQSALVLVPIALLSALQFGRREVDGGRADTTISSSPRYLVTLAAILVLAAATLLVSGWWYIRNWRLYGDLFGLGAFQAEFATQPFVATSAVAWVEALAQLHASFWARFGWMNVPPPAWVIWSYGIIEIVAVVGLLCGLGGGCQRRDTETRRQGDIGGWEWQLSPSPRPPVSPSLWRSSLVGHWSLLALPALAFGWVISFAITAGLVAWQGRLLFPALPALAIVLATGIENAKLEMPNRLFRSSNVTFYILHFALFVLALWLPFCVIRPAYLFRTLPEDAALERLGTPVYGRIGMVGERGAELRGWRLDGSPRPGSTLELTLMWHALARQNRDWTVFIHVLDAREQIVAEDNRQPRSGAFPMTQWVAGDWVEDVHPLALPANLAPGTYHIHVGLFYPRTTRRAGVYSQRGKLMGDFLDLGNMTVEVSGGS
jgi:4-amino-4-deoxy-L-arabinose transferase-like glycosyltransferase